MSLEIALQKISSQQETLLELSGTGGQGPSLGHRPNDRSGSARAAWMVGEQLKDILRAQPSLSELVAQDLDVEEMSLAACEKKIKDFADKHKTGNFACVIPSEAERIIREFYGLPSGPAAETGPADGGRLRLEDFF